MYTRNEFESIQTDFMRQLDVDNAKFGEKIGDFCKGAISRHNATKNISPADQEQIQETEPSKHLEVTFESYQTSSKPSAPSPMQTERDENPLSLEEKIR